MAIKFYRLGLKPMSDAIIPEGSVLMVNVIKSAAGDINVTMNTVDRLPCDFSSCESALSRTQNAFLNMDFPTEKPSMGPTCPTITVNLEPQPLDTGHSRPGSL